METQSEEAGRLNLTLDRGPSVWPRLEPQSPWQRSPGWTVIGIAAGAALTAWGVSARSERRRSAALMISAAAAAAAVLAFRLVPNFLAMIRERQDAVDTTSLDSFPASDAPSSRQVG